MLAYLTVTEDVALGAMISMSHNPMQDNGIGSSHGGFKLEDRAEDAIEKLMSRPWERPIGDSVGDIGLMTRAQRAYIEHLVRHAELRFVACASLLTRRMVRHQSWGRRLFVRPAPTWL